MSSIENYLFYFIKYHVFLSSIIIKGDIITKGVALKNRIFFPDQLTCFINIVELLLLHYKILDWWRDEFAC